MKKIFSLLFILTVYGACFESGGDSRQGASAGKNLAITVSGSRSFNTDIIHGQIDHYRITTTADDLHKPFVQTFGGKSESARITDIPPGPSRTITVEAVNPNGAVIRRGVKEGVTIVPGEFSHVTIVMHSVPVFTNVRDKTTMNAKRVRFEIFAEPHSRVEILELSAEGDFLKTLSDLSTTHSLLDTSANEDGLYAFDPGPFSAGVHHFLLRDLASLESTPLSLTLDQTPARPGIALTAGGGMAVYGSEMTYSSVGQFYFRPVNGEKGDLGMVSFFDIIDLSF